MEHNRNNRLKLEKQLKLAIKELNELPRNSPSACKTDIRKLLLLNEVTHCTVEYTIHYGDFSHSDCAELHSHAEDIVDRVTEAIYSCIKSNNECVDPLRLKQEINSLRWTENINRASE